MIFVSNSRGEKYLSIYGHVPVPVPKGNDRGAKRGKILNRIGWFPFLNPNCNVFVYSFDRPSAEI